MSRKILGIALLSMVATNAWATDACKYPPGQKPYCRPRGPCPNGVLAPEACFGYFNTKWTQWNQACGPEVASGHSVTGHSCTDCASKGIILFESDSAAKQAPSQTVVKPAPEAVPQSAPPKPMPQEPVPPKPMPPVKK